MSQSFDDFIKSQRPKPKGYVVKGSFNPAAQPFNPAAQPFNPAAQPFNPGQPFNPQSYNPGYDYQSYQSIQRSATPISNPSLPTSGTATPNPNASSTSLSSLNTALSKLNVNVPFSDNLSRIEEAQKISEVRSEVAAIVESISDYELLEEYKMGDIVRSLGKPKNSPLVREAAMALVSGLARANKAPGEAHLLGLFGPVFDAHSDKDRNVQKSAKSAAQDLYSAFPIEAVGSVVFEEVLSYLSSSAKWTSKMGGLVLVERMIDEVPADLLEMEFVRAVPVLTDLSTDFKPELAKQGLAVMRRFVGVLDNLDLVNKYDLIVDTLAQPQKVPECIRSLSSVTFVAEVTEPALSLLVPILDKSLKMSSSSNEQLRQTVAVTENLTRLVNNKREIETFIPILLPGVQKVVDNASLPEVRELAEKALKVLKDAENEKSDGKFHGRISREEGRRYVSGWKEEEYLGVLVQVDANVNDWGRLEKYLKSVSPAAAAGADKAPESESESSGSQVTKPADAGLVISKLRALFDDSTPEETSDGAIEIVNADFSLAYGTRMLLNKTKLRLLKGHRYGLCGRNGAGKSTLMRAISKGQLEGFPSADEVKTCFVEHKLQGSEADMDLVSFIGSDSELAHVGRDKIQEALKSVGFPDERLEQNVGSLSGGWKMKLELARAMLLDADVLLLDEPTNHLDVANVRWLEEYLVKNTEITSLIVSHDSGFLDNVCTDIIHYENKKLAYYRGNLSAFVEKKPEGKSYYTLTDSNVKMTFPPPGILTGVKSNTRAVARMTNVTFTYPGASKPQMENVSCSLSLSSRVAILGPNGAGKSTLIKLLTGETIPDSGTVEKHPNLRIGYIAQHALQHVEQHKEKTANQYLQWRYRFGDDREVLLKESRKFSKDEEEQMAKTIDIGDGRGPRAIEALVGRQKLKKSFQYEVKWKLWLPKYNSWVPKEVLIQHGFDKLVQKFDDHEASREGLGYRELTPSVIRKHFEGVGLDGDIADHTPMGSLSGGQLVKVVIAGAMWNNPHLLVLDEPTNYLDRDSLGGLAVAIREWSGGVVMISHNNEFVGALCPEQWHVENGKVVQKGTVAVDEKRFEDGGNEVDDSPANIKVRTRKKKMTRNEKKLQAERRRLRYLEWLNTPKGTPRPEDTDDEE